MNKNGSLENGKETTTFFNLTNRMNHTAESQIV